MDIISFILADLSYIISFIFYKKNCFQKGFFFLVSGLVFHTLSIIGRWLLTGYPPFFTLYEILIFFSWSIVFLSLVTRFHKVSGMFVALLAWIILGIVCFLNPSIRGSLPVEFKTILFPIHVSACLLGYGAFFISFICGILYLKHELTQTDTNCSIARNQTSVYDLISYRAVVFGLVFFSSGIIIGSVWAKQAWGNYWSWDPKETAALITWIIYAIWLFTRLVLHWKEKYSAYLTIFGFFAILFTWFGVNYFFTGLHSYK